MTYQAPKIILLKTVNGSFDQLFTVFKVVEM